LLDIKYYKTAKTIYTGSNPVSITYANNYIFTANVNSHTVSMLEAREHYKVMDFPIEHYPVYTASIPYNNNIVVVTAGKGKIDTTQEKTNAMIYIINPQSKSVIYSAPIEYSAVKAIDVIPNGLVVSDKNMMFISSQAALFYLNATSPSNPMIVKKEAYKSVSFNPFMSELILIKNINNAPSAHTGSNTNGKTLSDLFLPNNYVTLCPL